jgi:hypothetical protein
LPLSASFFLGLFFDTEDGGEGYSETLGYILPSFLPASTSLLLLRLTSILIMEEVLLERDYFLGNHFQFVIHESSNYSTLCSLIY